MSADSDEKLLIGHLAKLAGVKADTIRFYERIGLLPKPERKERLPGLRPGCAHAFHSMKSSAFSTCAEADELPADV